MLLHGCTAASPTKEATEVTPNKTHFKNHTTSTDNNSTRFIELSTIKGFRKNSRNINDA